MNSQWWFVLIAAFSFFLAASSFYFLWQTPYVITPEDLTEYRAAIDEIRNGPATIPLSQYVGVLEGILEFRTKTLETQRSFFKVFKWSSVTFLLIGVAACMGWWHTHAERGA